MFDMDYLIEGIRQDIKDGKYRKENRGMASRLSPEEKDRRMMIVRAMKAEGAQNKKIAQILDMAESSVYHYIDCIMKEDRRLKKEGKPPVEIPDNWRELCGVKDVEKPTEERKTRTFQVEKAGIFLDDPRPLEKIIDEIVDTGEYHKPKPETLKGIINDILGSYKVSIRDFFDLPAEIQEAVRVLVGWAK